MITISVTLKKHVTLAENLGLPIKNFAFQNTYISWLKTKICKYLQNFEINIITLI